MTTALEMRADIAGLHAILPHRLHVAELVQPKVGKFAAKATFLHTTKRNAGITGAVTIDKYATTLQA